MTIKTKILDLLKLEGSPSSAEIIERLECNDSTVANYLRHLVESGVLEIVTLLIGPLRKSRPKTPRLIGLYRFTRAHLEVAQ